MPEPDPDQLLDPEEVSRILKVPVTTLYRWRHFGTGPAAYRIGRHLRYRRRDVQRWTERQKIRS